MALEANQRSRDFLVGVLLGVPAIPRDPEGRTRPVRPTCGTQPPSKLRQAIHTESPPGGHRSTTGGPHTSCTLSVTELDETKQKVTAPPPVVGMAPLDGATPPAAGSLLPTARRRLPMGALMGVAAF